MRRPLLALTLGDPAGIGPELALRALADPDVARRCQLALYGSLRLLERAAAAAGLPLPDTFETLAPGAADSPPAPDGRHRLLDFPFAEADTLRPGAVQAACGRQAHLWIAAATRDVLQGRADALVTGPVCKEALRLAGVPFPGHTELLAHLSGAADPCMAFHSPDLFVSLATIHEPLAAVPRLLSVPLLLRTLQLTHAACVRLGTPAPRLGLLALNPHAGEHGLFGDEEARVLAPALAAARAAGLDVHGPLVPDTAFTWLGAAPRRAPFDAYVALYHDQGLIPFKLAAFDTGVNLTLGLPLVRTSPDHGTAFDIAWQGKASPDSLLSALRLAARLAAPRAP